MEKTSAAMSRADTAVLSRDNVLTDLVSEDEDETSKLIGRGDDSNHEREKSEERARDSDDTDLEIETEVVGGKNTKIYEHYMCSLLVNRATYY